MTPVTTDDTRHECPAPGCTKRVPFEMFACRQHWFSIPVEIRHELWREYRHQFGEDSYFRARAACLRALGVAEEEIAQENAGVR